MLTETAVKFYGNRMRIARALKLTKSAVYQWRRVVPKASAQSLEKMSGGAIKVDEALYESNRPVNNASHAAA